MIPLAAILSIGEKVLDKVLPDPEAKAKAMAELAKIEAEGRLAELQADQVAMQETSKRWEADMKSDSFLSKNIRPMVLIYLTFIFTVLAFFHGNIGGFEVDSQYVPIFQSLLITVYSAYFVGRTWEKTRNK